MALTPERWRQASEAFERLVDLPSAEQASALDALQRDDPDLAAVVRDLLGSDADTEGLLDRGVQRLAQTVLSALERDRPEELGVAGGPPEIAGFRIGERLGQGGMGEVYRAERSGGDVRQTVALKLLRPGMDSLELRRRFLRERRILAELEHPDIARFIDAGVSADGRPWLAMEYVEGLPITEFARRHGLGLAQRVRLLLRVARAVAFAQSRLVVHRDLKPSNILIDAEGRPRLLDFGIAKLIDVPGQPEATQTSLRPLSPAYAAPEQLADGAITTATDVFALGMVLHELLTGALPANRREGLTEATSRSPVARPSSCLRAAGPTAAESLGLSRIDAERLARAVAGDLDLVVLTALHPDPARRYASAAALAEELQRWLDGRGIAARGDSAAYRLRRFLGRHRLGVVASSLVLLALVAGLAAALWQAERAEAEAARATAEAERAERSKRFFARLLAETDPARHPLGAGMRVIDLIEVAAERIETELDGLPGEQAEIGLALGTALSNLREPTRALELIDRAVARLEGSHPGDPVVLVHALRERGILLNALGRPQQAEADARRALGMLEGLPGEHGIERVRLRTVLLTAARFQGHYAELVTQSEAVLRDREQLLGDGDAPDLAVDWFNLGVAYGVVDRHAEAVAALRRADELLQRAPGFPEARRVWILNGLGGSLRLSGELEAAGGAYAEAAEVAARTLGPGHAMRANALLGQGSVARDAGSPQSAEALLREALALLDDPSVEIHARIRLELGELLLEQGDVEAALVWLEGGVADLAQRSQGSDPLLLKWTCTQALARARKGDIEAALRESEAAQAALDALSAPTRRYRGEAALQHAALLRLAGRDADAETWRARGETELRVLWPQGHPRLQALLGFAVGSQ
jgi:eukaryotic-like serine/threonine-protein kinase